MAFYRSGREHGSFDQGIEMAIRRLLADPEFLYRKEAEPAGVAVGRSYRISDYDLASRLSFFLWSSIPDDELLDVAASGKLSDNAVIETQVRRMLADRRSSALMDNFAEQWLGLRALSGATPDRSSTACTFSATSGTRSTDSVYAVEAYSPRNRRSPTTWPFSS